MPEFGINDRRSSARNHSGLVVGQSLSEAKSMARTAQGSRRAPGATPTDFTVAREMALSRRKHSSQTTSALSGGSFGGGSSGSISFATQRPRDPFFYWQQNNLPYDFDKPDHLAQLRGLCRHIYRAHPVMASAIDIFSAWPITGMELVGKDKELNTFYEDLLFDQLNYEEFLSDVGREFWTVGETFALGSWNASLGIWEDDELLNPDDVYVEKSPFLKDPNYFIRLPETLRRVLQTGQPTSQFAALMRSYPELQAYSGENAKMPVSGMLLKHLLFRTSAFDTRGIPILYRALRPLMQEEMLNSAQDAIADRLYTPLVLAKIGATAGDLGTTDAWIPSDEQIASFESSLDAALAADFRVLTTHFAVEMSTVFGKETMPNFDADFDRLTEKQLQAFGMSKTLLSGGDSGETYAADALNRDLISQLLGRYQRYISKFVTDRMLIVAEAQEHFDYEVRGGQRFPIMEEVLTVDEETGEQKVVEQPKLLVPTLRLKNMNMKDEETERSFLEALRASGMPVSQRRRVVNIDLDLDAEVEATAEEQIEQAVEAQRVRKRTYQALKAEGLPIPADLVDDFQAKAVDNTETQPAADPTRVPTLGLDPQDTSALAPTPIEQQMPPGAPLGVPAGPGGTVDSPGGQPGFGGHPGAPGAHPGAHPGAQVIPLPVNRMQQRTRPVESDEMRKSMPKPAALRDSSGEVITDVDGKPVISRLASGPTHVGRRALAGITADTVLADDSPG